MIDIGDRRKAHILSEDNVKIGFGHLRKIGQLLDGDLLPVMLSDMCNRSLQTLVAFCGYRGCGLQQKPDHGIAITVILPDVIGGKKTVKDRMQFTLPCIGKDGGELIELVHGKGSVDLHLQKDPTAGHGPRCGVEVMRDRLLHVCGRNKKAAIACLLRATASKRNVVASFHRLHDGEVGQDLDMADALMMQGAESAFFELLDLHVLDLLHFLSPQ